MSEIKRYDEMYHNGVDEVEDGPLVKYDDHAAIVAEKDARIAELESRWENRSPTPFAYDAACKALEKHRARADAAEEQVRELADESNKWKPEVCPVTKRPFFMWIEHPDGGMIPTYGGPYDSYTIPVVDSDGEFSCERYDHDEGAWVDGVCLSERLIDDQMHVLDDAAIREIRAQAVSNLPKVGDGKEQEAFEIYARSRNLDLSQHPLHYLFLDGKTNQARSAWRECLVYVSSQLPSGEQP